MCTLGHSEGDVAAFMHIRRRRVGDDLLGEVYVPSIRARKDELTVRFSVIQPVLDMVGVDPARGRNHTRFAPDVERLPTRIRRDSNEPTITRKPSERSRRNVRPVLELRAIALARSFWMWWYRRRFSA